VRSLVLDLIKQHGPIGAKDGADRIGMQEKAFRSAIDQLRVEGHPVWFDRERGGFWWRDDVAPSGDLYVQWRRSFEPAGPLWGKYRGIVAENKDPLRLARLMVSVPSLGSRTTGWAMPALPIFRLEDFSPPPVGSNVWVEFEHGDPSYPVWTGFFWTNESA
jgi:hypothetical protein